MFVIRCHGKVSAVCPTVAKLREKLVAQHLGASVSFCYQTLPHGMRRSVFVDVLTPSRAVESYGEQRQIDFDALAEEVASDRAAAYLHSMLERIALDGEASRVVECFPMYMALCLDDFAQDSAAPDAARLALRQTIENAGGLYVAMIDAKATVATAAQLEAKGHPKARAHPLTVPV